MPESSLDLFKILPFCLFLENKPNKLDKKFQKKLLKMSNRRKWLIYNQLILDINLIKKNIRKMEEEEEDNDH